MITWLRADGCVNSIIDQTQLPSNSHVSSPFLSTFAWRSPKLIRNRVRIAASFSPWSTSLTTGTLRKASWLSSRNPTCRWLIRNKRRETKDGQRPMTGDRIFIRSWHAKFASVRFSAATANTRSLARSLAQSVSHTRTLALPPSDHFTANDYVSQLLHAWGRLGWLADSPISVLTFARTSSLSQPRSDGRGSSNTKKREKKKKGGKKCCPCHHRGAMFHKY